MMSLLSPPPSTTAIKIKTLLRLSCFIINLNLTKTFTLKKMISHYLPRHSFKKKLLEYSPKIRKMITKKSETYSKNISKNKNGVKILENWKNLHQFLKKETLMMKILSLKNWKLNSNDKIYKKPILFKILKIFCKY